jgi:hypothetical protein
MRSLIAGRRAGSFRNMPAPAPRVPGLRLGAVLLVSMIAGVACAGNGTGADRTGVAGPRADLQVSSRSGRHQCYTGKR